MSTPIPPGLDFPDNPQEPRSTSVHDFLDKWGQHIADGIPDQPTPEDIKTRDALVEQVIQLKEDILRGKFSDLALALVSRLLDTVAACLRNDLVITGIGDEPADPTTPGLTVEFGEDFRLDGLHANVLARLAAEEGGIKNPTDHDETDVTAPKEEPHGN